MDDLLCSEDKTDFAGMSFEKLLGFYYLRMFYLGYDFFFLWILKDYALCYVVLSF